jgi:hypothetical protein
MIFVEGIPKPHNKRVDDDRIIEAYKATGSVWKAAKLLGLCGQSVHERLHTLGWPLKNRAWTKDEDTEIVSLCNNSVPVGEIGWRIGRTFAAVACRLNELGVKKPPRRAKAPRGAGYDKASVLAAMKELEKTHASVRNVARKRGVHGTTLIERLREICPERLAAYTKASSLLPESVCPNCQRPFVPMTKKQKHCSGKCANHARNDRLYFGGKRSTTIGLAEGVCQLCKREIKKGLSSHHILGKENDPDNDALIALCQGCHNIITLLATRKLVDDPTSWESLITLAWFRRHGAEIAKLDGEALYVSVQLEQEPDDDWGELSE